MNSDLVLTKQKMGLRRKGKKRRSQDKTGGLLTFFKVGVVSLSDAWILALQSGLLLADLWGQYEVQRLKHRSAAYNASALSTILSLKP